MKYYTRIILSQCYRFYTLLHQHHNMLWFLMFFFAKLSHPASIGWVALSSLVRSFVRSSSVRPASVTSPLISTMWCFRPHKPYIFWKLMTPTIYSIINRTDPPETLDPPNPLRTHPTWPFLHFMPTLHGIAWPSESRTVVQYYTFQRYCHRR